MDDLVDGMLSGDPALWESTVDKIQALPRKQHADLWGAMLSRLARHPPPIQGDLSRDQWLSLCREHYRELYVCATNKQPTQYVSQGPSSGAEGGVAHGGNVDLQPVVQPLNEIRTLVTAIGNPVDEIRGLAVPVDEIRRSVAALPDPGPAIGALLPEIQAIMPEIRAITPQIQSLVPGIQAILPDIANLQQPLIEIRARVNALTDPGPGIASVLQALTGLQAGTTDNMPEIRTLLLPLNEIRTQVSSLRDPVPEIRSLLQPLTGLQAGASNLLPEIRTLLQPLSSSLVELQSNIYTRPMGDYLARNMTDNFHEIDAKIRDALREVQRSNDRHDEFYNKVLEMNSSLEEIKGKMDQATPAMSSVPQGSGQEIADLQREILVLRTENQKLILDEQPVTENLWQSIWDIPEQQQQIGEMNTTPASEKKDMIGIIGKDVQNLISFWGNNVGKDPKQGLKKTNNVYFACKADIESIIRTIKNRFKSLINPLETKERSNTISTANLKYLHNLKMFLTMIEMCYEKEEKFPAALIVIAFNINNATKTPPIVLDYTQFGVLNTGKTLYFSKVLDMFQISVKIAHELQATGRASSAAAAPVTDSSSKSILNWDSDSWFSSFS